VERIFREKGLTLIKRGKNAGNVRRKRGEGKKRFKQGKKKSKKKGGLAWEEESSPFLGSPSSEEKGGAVLNCTGTGPTPKQKKLEKKKRKGGDDSRRGFKAGDKEKEKNSRT